MNRTALRTLVAVACSAALALSAAGCGSDDKKDDAKSAPTLTADEFKTQANQLCADANKDTESYGADISETSSDADVTAAIKQTTDRFGVLIAAIDDLKAPEDLNDDIASMLDSVKAGASEMSEVSSVQDLVAFDPNSGVFKEANDKASALGLTECAE